MLPLEEQMLWRIHTQTSTHTSPHMRSTQKEPAQRTRTWVHRDTHTHTQTRSKRTETQSYKYDLKCTCKNFAQNKKTHMNRLTSTHRHKDTHTRCVEAAAGVLVEALSVHICARSHSSLQGCYQLPHYLCLRVWKRQRKRKRPVVKPAPHPSTPTPTIYPHHLCTRTHTLTTLTTSSLKGRKWNFCPLSHPRSSTVLFGHKFGDYNRHPIIQVRTGRELEREWKEAAWPKLEACEAKWKRKERGGKKQLPAAVSPTSGVINLKVSAEEDEGLSKDVAERGGEEGNFNLDWCTILFYLSVCQFNVFFYFEALIRF